jgi:type I restriction enzyme M protein
MNTETKRHIDAARQVLVGVVPNPTSQIDQITNALIYKFMDDMDQAAIKAGGDPSFFVGELERYAWTRLMDQRMGNQERMNLYSEALLKFSEAKQLPELFRGIFKSAFLPYRSPEVLGLFLNEINYFDYSHSEELGNAYEYLLSIMSSQGDAGQFRTPRHIIDFIVDVVNPTKDDKVLDPACGTGGFLVSSYRHILEQHDGKDDPEKKEKPLTPDEKRKLMNNFEGYDIDPGMVRIAQVNTYLHQFKNPKIFQYDSLASDEHWNDKFDVILANPPFMSPKGGIKPHTKFGVQSSRAEVLFVDYIMSHLRPGGRAGVIVPEGIIFQSGAAYKQLRKNLVEDGLYAVVSLPSGVFAPYSGVKTSILLFNNELAKTSKEVLFVKIEQDGFDLGATKRQISRNDLPAALEILNKWNTGEKVENKLAVYVEKSKIAENSDYNLSADRYRVATDYSSAKWPMVQLGEISDLESGSRQKGGAVESGVYSIGGEQISEDGAIRFDKMKYITEAHFSEMRKGILAKGDVLMVKDGATTGKMGFWNYDYRAAVNEHVFIFRAKEQILPKYLYDVLLSDFFQYELKPYIRGIIGGISLEIKHIEIPLPPLEIQEQIVAELDGYAGIITGAKQIVQNWKPKIYADPDWDIKNLKDVCTQITDGTHQTPEYTDTGVPFLRVTDITESNESKKFISKEEHKELIKRCRPEKEDVLYTKNGTIGIAKMVDWDYEFSIFVSLALLKPKKDILNGKYLEHFLNSELAMSQAKAHSKAGTITNLHLIEIKQFKIPLPSLAVQKQIVEKIEAERSLVESSKKLIEIYEEKTKEVIAKLWRE